MIIMGKCQDHLFDFYRLRHRQDIELKIAGHGPFEIMGLICLGILGPATDRTLIRLAPLTASEEASSNRPWR
jgi:hypothetical protein